jgi:hypothetical protein
MKKTSLLVTSITIALLLLSAFSSFDLRITSVDLSETDTDTGTGTGVGGDRLQWVTWPCTKTCYRQHVNGEWYSFLAWGTAGACLPQVSGSCTISDRECTALCL